MERIVRIGSRESKLAVRQCELVREAIAAVHPEIRVELVTMKTTGDKILDRTLDKVGGKGLFVKELDEALADGRVDFCVHCVKDMPIEENPNLPVVAVSPREDPRDVLILPLEEREDHRPVRVAGSAGLRRTLQYALLCPDWRCEPVRGNVITRLEKLDRGEFDALILAAAGIRRLGLEGRISRVFEPEEMLPAAGQGVLAIQGRRGEDYSYLEDYHDRDAWDAVVAERSFVRALNGGCSSPVAAYAQIQGGELHLRGLYVDEALNLFPGEITGNRRDGAALGAELAQRLKRGDSNG